VDPGQLRPLDLARRLIDYRPTHCNSEIALLSKTRKMKNGTQTFTFGFRPTKIFLKTNPIQQPNNRRFFTMVQSLIVFIAAALSPFSLAHVAASFSGHFNATRTTRSLRGNRVDDGSGSQAGAIGNVAAPGSAGMPVATYDEAMSHQNERILQQLMPASFVPLGCNKDPCANGEMKWTEFNPRVGQLVVIPCGVCVTMDYNKNDVNGNTTNGFYLKLLKGLEIQGSLIFPDRTQYRLTIETPSVVVQGNLDMSAASSRVTGQPLIRFILTGSDKVTFTPVGINEMACAVENSSGKLVASACSVGIKPFVVAGGHIDVRGLPATCKTWVKLKDIDGPLSTLLVPADGVSTCWSKGAEILITSHTTQMEDAQVRRLVKAPYSLNGDNGLVRLDLDKSIVPPVTARQDEGFEVEVALLSRNIVIQGAKDESDSLLGGHFMVMNTPKVAQVVEGIEFNNCGRQGKSEFPG
jgi:G8 domain